MKNAEDQYEITFNSWNSVAAIYQQNFMHLTLYNDTYNAFCNLIQQQQPDILEIGCGPGNITRYLLQKRQDFNIYGIDISPQMVALARKNNPEATFNVSDCRQIHTITNRYMGIVCGFCIPYLSPIDCHKLFADCHSLLLNSGLLYISAIEGNYALSGWETSSDGRHRMYVYYYEENDLISMLEAASFTIVKQFRKPYSKADGTASTHIIIIAQATL